MSSNPQSPDLALILWLKSLDLPYFQTDSSSEQPRSFDRLSQISDGEILWQLLSSLDSAFFRAPRPSSISEALSEAWVLRFTSFKKMYKLIVRYFEEEVRKSTRNVKNPNLQKVARDGDVTESISLCMIILTLATLVQPDAHVPKIQALPTWAQTALMVGIEAVSSQLITLEMNRSPHRDVGLSGEGEDVRSLEDTLTRPRSSNSNYREEDSTLLERLRALEVEHRDLQSEMRLLHQTNQDTNHKLFMTEQDLKASQEELRNLELERTSNHRRREHDFEPASDDDGSNSDHPHRNSHNRQEYLLRGELEQSKAELTNLGVKLDLAEETNEKNARTMEDMRKRLDELGDVEEVNRGLRDQLDEVRHEMERARKLENVIEKYKKKLDESADLRRQMKTLEEQNSDLLDRHTALEDEYHKVVAFKPLMEQYKSKIATLESELSSQKRENDRLQYELDATTLKLQKAEEERDREGEELALYEERVKELEEVTPITHTRRRKKTTETEEGEEGDTSTTAFDASFDRHVDEETGIIEGIGGELNDAIEGRTMTSLKLELRKLQREIKILRSAQDEDDDGGNGTGKKSRYLVLENLLEDANRMKRKYEDDYLKQYRETLVLTNQLEEIRSGKSMNGEGAEASIALRQRLNETTEELEKLKAEHIELTVSYEQVNHELTLTKSDLNLIGKDQLEMLSSLRDSVSTEKIALMDELDRLKKEQGNLRDQLAMKTEQIQSLLLEKINLQSDSIDQRERLLVRERELSGGQVKSPKTNELSEEARTKLGVTEQLYKEKDDECRMLKAKLDKAKLFIMSQDKLYKESPVDISSLTSNYDETVQTYQAELSSSKDLIDRLRNQYHEMETRYAKELRLMVSAWHNLGQQKMRETIALNRNEHSNPSGLGRQTSSGVGYRVGSGNQHLGKNGAGSGPRGSSSHSNNLGFGGQLRPQSWVKQQRDRMINQYALLHH
ncbi:hypothetical protein, variant [Puccinia triticina 1-1 BBBD Race 1]|uniref:HOOK N-terminal domain-containing protein n=1 Tax=Puccinia triticina (isolate 1-1 / race 1 (BBBD)) TaxID=630390 RepID=A0A180GSR2_PUCT1|nr:hypothetical protein, variant [Puccinia triticina 1-1 BBBD Race 1]WAR63858.1 hypothetical protein PtB15_16B17 [Puccinia triticina]